MRWTCVVLSLVVLMAVAGAASASMTTSMEYTLDLTKPQAPTASSVYPTQITATWPPADRLAITSDGLGWDGPDNASCDAWVETSEPIGVGWSWRTVQSVIINAEVEWSTEAEAIGALFVRHSPDAEHWSSWIQLGRAKPGDDPTRRTYEGTVGVPYRDRATYYDLLAEYAKLDVPWKSDEEAAVRWILEGDPAYFEKASPFVGHLQFLYETQLAGGRRIRGMKLQLSYSAGGIHHAPQDPEGYAGRDIPWRFTADSPSPRPVPPDHDADSGRTRPSAVAWGEPHDGLRIGISVDDAPEPVLRAVLENVGEEDLVLNLGAMFANGRAQYPTAVRLMIVGPEGRALRSLQLQGPPGVAGRMDPMVVPLPRGASYTLRCALADYVMDPGPNRRVEPATQLDPGPYDLIAEFTGAGVSKEETNNDMEGLALMPYWTGTVRSANLRFTIPNSPSTNPPDS